MENSSSKNSQIKKVERKIPKSVPFILIVILLERYSTTANSAVLLFYLHKKLGFDQSTSTAIFHTNESLAYLFPIFGAIIAESYWGLFKTLSIMSFVFAMGSGITSISGIESLNLPIITLTIIGLLIAVTGSGSIRANLTAFGGQQYEMPEQSESLQLYFSIQIMFLKCGSLLGRITNPMLKDDVKCFGMNDCYPLAFGATSIAMMLALIILLCGKSFYRHKPPTENVFLKFCGCILCGMKGKFMKISKNEAKNHWLDYASDKYDQQVINDTKRVLNILTVFIPFPIYWAVYMQQSSRWIFQATRMNLDVGWFKIKPDQMIALNPIFGILLMPLCTYIFFPAVERIKTNSLLYKIAIGGLLCCTAFVIAIFVELEIQKNFISILWIFPQFAVLALSENFAFTSMLNFAFIEGPSNMKSVMTACVFVTIALGNLIITAISGLKLFSSQVYEFSFFNGVLIVFLIFFLFLISRYKGDKNEKVIKK